MPYGFEAVAIVGRACLLPGASSPDELWRALVEGRDLVGKVPDGYWRLDPRRVLSLAARADNTHPVASDRGGYVRGFHLDADGFALPADQLRSADVAVQWLAHVGRAALRDAGFANGAPPRTAVIAGNLAYPSHGLSQFAERAWLEQQDDEFLRTRAADLAGLAHSHPDLRSSTGLPALLLARAVGADGRAFCLDAACASSLYALKLACDQLHDGDADAVLVGAVNRADDLFLHGGFTALRALSRTGRSRPFHRDADGLLPAEGAAMVVLKRLADAERDGNRILGVIRAVGLSNDGRSGGLLVPSAAGQVRALESAYAQSGIDPADISLVECHATGTAVGDREEIVSMARVFGGGRAVPIGSHKSNMGHLITAAGMAGLLKVLGAIEHGVRPPALHAEEPIPELVGSRDFRLLTAAEPWTSTAPRRAAVNAFGFGGNNAHLLVEEWRPRGSGASASRTPKSTERIAVVGLGVVAGDASDSGAFARVLLDGAPHRKETASVDLPLGEVRFPPADLQHSLAQQTAFLRAALEATHSAGGIDGHRAGVLVGMQCDAEIARHGLQWRLPEWVNAWQQSGARLDAAWLEEARRANALPLEPATVLGTMPNMPANRLNSQLDLRGLGFTVASEEASGIDALHLAARALRHGELDVALIGAVDLCCEPVHRSSMPADAPVPGDAAVALVLKRESDARRDGNAIYAILDESAPDAVALPLFGEGGISTRFGHAKAASGLVAVAAAAIALAARRDPFTGAPWLARAGERRIAPASERVVLRDSVDAPSVRIVTSLPAPCVPTAKPILGEVALVFTGAAAAYRGMGRELVQAMPELVDRMAERCAIDPAVARWMFEPSDAPPTPFDQLKGSTVLCQVHAELALSVLGLRPAAALGMSSGETNSLFAFGAWRDMGAMFSEIAASGMYDVHLGGRFESARQAWGISGPVQWCAWRVRAPVADVERELRVFPRVHLTIVNAPTDCVIAGDAAQCERVVARIGAPRCAPLQHDFIAHAPELAPFAGEWRRIHRRTTHPVPGVRFYSNAANRSYQPEADACADALLAQAVQGVDFRPTVEQAWNDGVRIFVEVGPRNAMARAIGAILRGREHLCVSFDRAGRPALEQIAEAVANLAAAGVAVDAAAFVAALHGVHRFGDGVAGWAHARMLTLPGHPGPVVLPPVRNERARPRRPQPVFGALQAMAPAPAHPVFTSALRPVAATDPVGALLAAAAAVHHEFLDHQTRVHAESLSLQRRAFEVIVGGAALPAAAAPAARPPKFTRADLEALATGRISDRFGVLFQQQDGFRRQVRMPAPPLLLADRVTAIEGEPGTMGLGTVWTETDVTEGAWYLHHGRMSPGVVIESGQADLLLISWLGVDFLNRGERVYRLLGCELEFHGALPRVGETLRFDIHVDGHANTGDVRLFFFHYDCHIGDRLLLSVREGQAGFFTDAELASSAGVLWDAAADTPKAGTRLDTPPQPSIRRAFSAEQLRSFLAGDAFACFGEGFEFAASHQRTPTIPSGRLRLLDSVSAFEPSGGPWGRGYLRADATVAPDHWFYDGHFHNDPCMPGTLMADAAVQALSFHMAALGFTIGKDGWRFEPVPDERFKFVCRGQVVPDRAHHLTYEIFVEEVIAGPKPTVYAALLCTADGLKVFHCRRFGVRLVPDWPLSTRPELLAGLPPQRVVRPDSDIRGDYAALLACAWGAPSAAFGEMYRRYDSRRVPRLPGPPYHFMTRVVAIDCPPGAPKVGATMQCEYDVPPDAWYFNEGGHGRMPYAALLETLLQPCGWMASYMGSGLGDGELLFRNLDGDRATPLAEVAPDAGTISIRLTVLNAANSATMRLVFFRVESFVGDQPLLSFDTSFGFFAPESFRKQAGLPVSAEQARWRDAANDYRVDMTRPPVRFAGAPRLGHARLRVLDTLTGYWPAEGAAGLGRMRASKFVDPGAWYFQAHFYQDPVQPGSLGIEALLQLLQCFCIERGLAEGIGQPRFQSPALAIEQRWKYRGQVLPTNREVLADIEVTRIERESGGVLVVAEGSLWVDGLRIYEVGNLAVRIVAGEGAAGGETVVDMTTSPWLADHAPTFSVPALPMMAMVDVMARAVAAQHPGLVVAIENVEASRWIPVNPSARLRTDVSDAGGGLHRVMLSVGTGNAFELAARADVRIGDSYAPPPAALAPLAAARPMPDPYATHATFHGPAFQLLRTLAWSDGGASATLDAGAARVPVGLLHPALLDAALHGVPHDQPEAWFEDAPPGMVAYPRLLRRITFYGPVPAGLVRAEVRAVAPASRPTLHVQILSNDTVWAEFHLVETLLPKGPLGALPPEQRHAFMARRTFVSGAALSINDHGATILDEATVTASNWLPGTVESVYRADPDALARDVAIKEHVARGERIHPSFVTVAGSGAQAATRPFVRFAVDVERMGERVTVRSAAPPALDLGPALRFWRERLRTAAWPGEEILFSLAERFVGNVVLAAPTLLEQLQGQRVLFLANHQVGIESPLFSLLGAALNRRPVVAIAKREHEASWLGRLVGLVQRYPGVTPPPMLRFFDRDNQASMLDLLATLARDMGREDFSVLVHAQGTRALQAREPVTRLSGAFLDFAVSAKLPIVPVRFAGALPVDMLDARLEFPLGYGRQDIYIGALIDPAVLAGIPLRDRKDHVLAAINSLGPPLAEETPLAGDPSFAAAVQRVAAERGLASPQGAVLQAMLAGNRMGPVLSRATDALLQERVVVGSDPEAAWAEDLRRWFLERNA